MKSAPAGIVTFLFTDVEGSTRLWAADTAATAISLELHDKIIKRAIEDGGGLVFGWAGDHFRGAFEDPRVAVAAAVAAQTALGEAAWGGPPLKVRMGLHRGRATQRDGDYFGPVPNTASRIEALARGGQILMSDAVRSEVDIETLALGEHRLSDVPEPVGIHQVGIESFRPLRTIDPRLSTLPNPGSSIIGRNDEITMIRGLLESSPMVTLTGIGGCGKTRLAIAVAYRELPSRPDGCYFADLSSVSDGSELAASLASAVRLDLSGGGDPMQRVVDHLGSRDALLVLDNCEHIIEACSEFAEALLARSSTTALLATTRQRLGVAGERVVAVPPLEHRTANSPAQKLFIERATSANQRFAPSSDDRFFIGEICERLDGMPLAIELAAARTSVLSPAEVLDRMADRFRLLSGGRGRHRRRTLQATLDWSYDLLDEDEQVFFCRLGLFVGAFDLPAAIAVSPFDEYSALDLLDSLVAKNLVAVDESQDGSSSWYRLLETVRIYAADQLTRSGDAAAAHDALVDHYRDLVQTTDWLTATDLDRALRLRWHWPNIASTLEHLASENDWEKAAPVAFGCHGMWETQIPATEGRRWTKLIFDHLEPGDSRDWVGYALAELSMQLDDFVTVHELLEDLVTNGSALPRTQAAGLFAFLNCRQHPDRARQLSGLCRSLVEEHQLGPEYALLHSWSLACLALYEARFEDALEGFRTAYGFSCSLTRQNNHRVISGLSLASAQILTGDPVGALVTLDGCDWDRSIWNSSPIVRAVALIDVGRPEEAADLVIGYGYDALRGRLARMANDALVGLAALALNRGEVEHAWKLLQQGAAPRTPFTIGLAEGLADRIDYGDSLRHMHRARQIPLSELDASEALSTELDRIRTTR